MSDLISRSELLKKFPVDMMNPLWHFTGIRATIENATDAEAEPVVHARWQFKEAWPNLRRLTITEFMRCTACAGVVERYMGMKNYRYCPFCGAKMDAKGDGNAEENDRS